MTTQCHWESVCQSKAADEVSWYRVRLDTSLALIRQSAPDRTAAIIDIGNGESTLIDDLVELGYIDLTVLDISAVALDVTRARLPRTSTTVQWCAADMTDVTLAAHHYQVWHDRAVFHFLTDAIQSAVYVEQVRRAVKPGGL